MRIRYVQCDCRWRSGHSAALSNRSFLYCGDCRTYVDLYNYDSLEDTGHAECGWRYVTDEEFDELVADCLEEGCISERPVSVRIGVGRGQASSPLSSREERCLTSSLEPRR